VSTRRRHRVDQQRERVPAETSARVQPSADDAYDIIYFRRHKDDDPNQATPGREFLASLPARIRAEFSVILIAVATAPPHKFAGGGKWEAMHGEMNGVYEVRVDGPPNRTHYRLFCVLDTKAAGKGPVLVIIDGEKKPFRTEMPAKAYRRVRRYRDEYFARQPRSIV
jgi:hypothetical protein